MIEDIFSLLHSGKIPHFATLFHAFMKGNLPTWERFSSEFKAGGKIAVATDAERRLAWVPATNDANDGSLGSIAV